MKRLVETRIEHWPLRQTFNISRSSSDQSTVVVVEIAQDGHTGRGECSPIARYRESPASVLAQIEIFRAQIEAGLDRDGLQQLMPAGATRNALDCALWDLDARLAGRRVWQLAGLAPPQPVTTVMTISLDSAEKMGADARAAADYPMLKLKLTGDGDLERVAAVRDNAPNAKLVVDANEGWRADQVEPFSVALKDLGVIMIEQPLPAAEDALLAELPHPLPICADESCHTRADLPRLAGRYDMINIKLDKTGGLTEALALRAQAIEMGFGIMVGCMVGTSLSMAPGLLAAQGADVVDLDGPLWMRQDREPGLNIVRGVMQPSTTELWG